MNALQFIETSIGDGIGYIFLNRPKQLNAINRKMVREIVSTMEEFDRDPQVKVILITGNGKAFSAGADIDEMMDDNPIKSGVNQPICRLGPNEPSQEACDWCCEKFCIRWWF